VECASCLDKRLKSPCEQYDGSWECSESMLPLNIDENIENGTAHPSCPKSLMMIKLDWKEIKMRRQIIYKAFTFGGVYRINKIRDDKYMLTCIFRKKQIMKCTSLDHAKRIAHEHFGSMIQPYLSQIFMNKFEKSNNINIGLSK